MYLKCAYKHIENKVTDLDIESSRKIVPIEDWRIV